MKKKKEDDSAASKNKPALVEMVSTAEFRNRALPTVAPYESEAEDAEDAEDAANANGEINNEDIPSPVEEVDQQTNV